MSKKNIFKKILAGIGVTALLFGIIPTSQVNAYGYSNTFTQPWEGSAETTSAQYATNNPHVNPYVNATQTTYCLVAATNLTVVSSYVKTSTTGSKTFTYKSGYGGSANKYRMNYFPSSRNYSTYNVHGNWKP